MLVTHLIKPLKSIRYVPGHHRRTPQNKTHAVIHPGLEVRSYATVVTLCGQAATVMELEDSYTPTYNCFPVESADDLKHVGCRDCKRLIAKAAK